LLESERQIDTRRAEHTAFGHACCELRHHRPAQKHVRVGCQYVTPARPADADILGEVLQVSESRIQRERLLIFGVHQQCCEMRPHGRHSLFDQFGQQRPIE
jgi:hypothetical protein